MKLFLLAQKRMNHLAEFWLVFITLSNCFVRRCKKKSYFESNFILVFSFRFRELGKIFLFCIFWKRKNKIGNFLFKKKHVCSIFCSQTWLPTSFQWRRKRLGFRTGFGSGFWNEFGTKRKYFGEFRKVDSQNKNKFSFKLAFFLASPSVSTVGFPTSGRIL